MPVAEADHPSPWTFSVSQALGVLAVVITNFVVFGITKSDGSPYHVLSYFVCTDAVFQFIGLFIKKEFRMIPWLWMIPMYIAGIVQAQEECPLLLWYYAILLGVHRFHLLLKMLEIIVGCLILVASIPFIWCINLACRRALNIQPRREWRRAISGLRQEVLQQSIGDECAVCIDKLGEGDTVRTLPCNHKFHKDCIDPWIAEHGTCPTCRCNIMCSVCHNAMSGDVPITTRPCGHRSHAQCAAGVCPECDSQEIAVV